MQEEGQQKPQSPRLARRREKLRELLEELGGGPVQNAVARGATQAQDDTGTPRTHFLAMAAGRRGLGDDLMAKLERTYGKPAGWFDASATTWPFSVELQDIVMNLPPEDLHFIEVAIWTHLRKDVPTELHYTSAENLRTQTLKPRPSTLVSLSTNTQDKGRQAR